jgi:hypothetical protein
MFKKVGLGFIVLLLAAAGFVWFKLLMPLQASADRNGPGTAARDYALQDNSKLTPPALQAAIYQAAPNPEMNLYWGELHLHTSESFDATLFGTTLGIEDAYRFAKGEPLASPSGEVMQLSLWSVTQRASRLLVSQRAQPHDLPDPHQGGSWKSGPRRPHKTGRCFSADKPPLA